RDPGLARALCSQSSSCSDASSPSLESTAREGSDAALTSVVGRVHARGSVEVRLLGQPFQESGQLGQLIREALDGPRFNRLRLASAWAKRSGLGRIASAVRSFTAAGGTAEAILGIDEGGTTSEALELAGELFDPLHVYFDPGPRTFH